MAQAILTRVLDDIKSLDSQELQMVEQAIRARLPAEQNGAAVPMSISVEQIATANALLRETIVMLPHPTGADNDSIDADLSREYGDDHEALYRLGAEP